MPAGAPGQADTDSVRLRRAEAAHRPGMDIAFASAFALCWHPDPVTVGSRAAISSLVVGVLVLVLATVLLPMRVTFGTHVLSCDSVAFSKPSDLIADAFCARAGAYRMRANLGIGTLLAVVSLGALQLGGIRASRRAWAAWAGVYVVALFGTLAILYLVGARHTTVVFDL
jgi:hypothetical protein